MVSFGSPPAPLCHTLVCGCMCVILYFSGLTARNFHFYLSFDLHCDISSRALLFLLSTSLYCVFIFCSYVFSSTLMYIFLLFFAFSRRKKEALPRLRPPPLMPPVWRHVLLCLVNYSSSALLQQQLSISRSPPAPSFPSPFSMH